MILNTRNRSDRSIRCFLQDEKGSPTVEFVLMTPLFIVFLWLVTDASLLFLRQTTLMNISRDTARIVSRHAMTPEVAKAYAESKASTVNAPAVATVTIANGFVTVVIASDAASSAPFGLIKFAVGDEMLITDCAFDIGSNARIDATVAISSRIMSASALNASSGAVVGDPLKNCDLSRKVYIMTMSSVSIPADFTASNIALIVNGNINIAANSSSSSGEHKGTSFHAEGSIQVPSNHTFNGCPEDVTGLIPGVRNFKFVIPQG